MMDSMKIYNKLKGYNHYINGWERMKRAAVFLLLVDIDGEANLIFEVRAKKLASQPGDICFPGGKIDEDELPVQTAFREIYEEIGIDQKDISFITELDTLVRNDGLIIHPFLGYIKNINSIKVSPDEVDHVFYAPISYFQNGEILEVENELKIIRGENFPYHLIQNGKNYKFKNGKSRSLFYIYKDYVIWGITAEILFSFINKINNN